MCFNFVLIGCEICRYINMLFDFNLPKKKKKKKKKVMEQGALVLTLTIYA